MPYGHSWRNVRWRGVRVRVGMADQAVTTTVTTKGKVKSSSSALCIMLASFSVLMLQVTIIRLLSVVLWYHWAFLSISLAMLGVGVPGVWFTLRPARREMVEQLLIVAGMLVPAAILAIIRLSHHFGEYRALFCVVCILPPMLALGGVVCLLLLEARGRQVSIIYGFDLLGACLGALLVIPAMHLFPTPQLAAGIGFVALAAAWVRRGKVPRVALVVAGVIIALLVWRKPFEIRHSKNYDEAQLKLAYERWTPTARLTFFDGIFWRGDQAEGFGWGMGTRMPKIRVQQYWMEQDGSAGTPIMYFDGDFDGLEFLLYDVTTVGYQLVSPQRVAIVGAGGGRDILSARLSGATQIDAVEINAGLVDVMSTYFKEFSGDVYHLEGVRPIVSEGRSFLRRSDALYDMIQISLIDSWAATAAGAFALSENNLYTLEAYQLYLSRLSEGGILSTSRWIRGDLGFEIPRLVALIKAALRTRGVSEPNAHLAIVEAGGVGTVLAGNEPFTPEQIERLGAIVRDRGLRPIYPKLSRRPASGRIGDGATQRAQTAPRRRLERSGIKLGDGAAPTAEVGLAAPGTPPVIEWVLGDEREASQRAGFDLSPPTDDRPFFFHVLPVFEPVDESLAARFGANGTAVRVLQILMAALTVVTLVLFFAPFALMRWFRRGPGFWRGSGYFACIGLGFMLIEVPWLQRFILFLEHPSHATTIVLACLLLGAGMGSLWSSRLKVAKLQRYGMGVCLLLALLNVVLPSIFAWAMPWSFTARAALAALLLVPVGVPLGLFFPLGMRRFGDDDKAWFWAVNGAFSVLASVVSLALAMQLGFANVTWVGIGAYGLGWLLLRGRRAGDGAATAPAS